MTETVNILGDLQRLNVKPGDSFLLRSRQPLPASAHEYLREAWAKFHSDKSPEDVPKLLILDGRFDLQVISTQADQEVLDVAQAIMSSSDEEVLKMITVDELRKLAEALLK